jgi:hypothetical protein
MPFLLSYNFIIQFVETFDPVKTFDLLDCDEVIQRVESTVDEFLFWSARTYVAVLKENGRWSSMMTPSMHVLLTKLVPELQRMYAREGTCSVAASSTAIFETGHAQSKRIADRHTVRVDAEWS